MQHQRRFRDESLRVLYRRRWTVGLTFLVVATYGSATSLKRTPVYEASARLLIERDARERIAPDLATADDATFYETQSHLLRSRALVLRTLEVLKLHAPPPEAERIAADAERRAAGYGLAERVAMFLGAPEPMPGTVRGEAAWRSARVDNFLRGVAVAPVPRTHLVDVRYRSTDATFAARAVNALAATFVEQRAAERSAGTMQIVDLAELPMKPVLPNHGYDLLISALAGCALGLALAFGVEYLDSRLKTPDDIRTHLGIPFLGLVPKVRKGRQTGSSLVLDHRVPPEFAEAVRTIRTAVVFSAAADRGRTVLVTSTAPEEGKTLISTNLASALAQAEQRTLVIDGDLRRPRVHSVFGVAQEPGLSDTLAGTASLETAIRPTSNPFLSVLPAGALPPNPAELLASSRYRSLLSQLAQEYDWIVLDAPPVMAVTDAAVMSHDAGGVLFVVGAEMTPRRNAQTALQHLSLAHASVIGAVLNRVNLERHAYYYAPYHRKDYTRAYLRTQ
jgi:capsular exopolysaccharide synthesis family protein